MHAHRNNTQTSFRLPVSLSERLRAQAQQHGRGLAAELRAAAEISIVVRAVYLLQHDDETRDRLGEEVTESQRLAQAELDHLCRQLFGGEMQADRLLADSSESTDRTMPPNDECSAGTLSIRMTADPPDRHEPE